MDCACFPNNGPMITAQPHMIPGYMGYVPQYKFKFGNTYGQQTNKLFLDPCVNMSPRAVLTDICPEKCDDAGGFLQHATGMRYGQCGCNDPYNCNKVSPFFPETNKGQRIKAPRFQTIMNHSRAPFCNRFCTKTFEQDQWRDKLFSREKQAIDGWRYCYKSPAYERPERLRPWDGDNSEYRRTQTTVMSDNMRDDLDLHLRGYTGPGKGERCPKGERKYKPMNAQLPLHATGDGSNCPPCELYRRHIQGTEKAAIDAGLKGIVKHPLFPTVQGNPKESFFCEKTEVLQKLNREQMSSAPENYLEGVIEELGELPILTLHKLAQKREDKSGKFYPEERGLARVCNPVGSSYLTARPFRSSPIYRVCEPVHPFFTGHVPGEKFLPGENRGKATRNALKYMTYRV